MKTGDKIKIRNPAGVLNVEVVREANIINIMRGYGDDKLPSLSRPRLELHKKANGEKLVTLFDQTNIFPSSIYMVLIDGDEIRAYIGKVEKEEEEDNDFLTWEV